jgi:6-phosphogluconolactonase
VSHYGLDHADFIRCSRAEKELGERMRIKVPALIGLLFLVSLGFLANCGKSAPSFGSGTGFLFVTTQGDSLVSPFTISLGTGALATNGKGVATGKVPSAIVLTPSGSALFVANRDDNTISAYTVNPDGTLSASGNPTPTGTSPVALAVDSGEKFLFVANQGSLNPPVPSTISVFSIQGTTLTPLAGTSAGNGTVSLAVTPDAKFLYAANKVDGTVTEYSIDATGALTQQGVPVAACTTPSAVCTAPSAVVTDPKGNFLYIANFGSNNIAAFTICDINCLAADGSLTPVTGSPFPAGLGPVSLAADPAGKFLYVVDEGANQVSEYRVSTATGALTPNSSASISTGTTPVWLAVRAGTTTVKASGGTNDFIYVANIGSASMSVFAFDSTIGVLSVVGAPVSTGGQPSAIAVK